MVEVQVEEAAMATVGHIIPAAEALAAKARAAPAAHVEKRMRHADDFQDQYFILIRKGTGQFFLSNLDVGGGVFDLGLEVFG